MSKKGLVVVYTGDGKGKTTAALGLAFRAVGQGLKVIMVQFIKGSWDYGELHTAKRLAPDFQIHQMGKGFTWEPKEPGEDERAAQEAFQFAREAVLSGQHDVVIMDELNYAVDYGLVKLDQVLELVREKPEKVHLVMTGRNARPEVIEVADLVTEMREIKHPFAKGISGMKGIEF